jgi:LuxR family transcriptional regulator, quorum-sensing system regulator CinR
VSSRHGYRGLFVVCSSQSEEVWAKFLSSTQAELIQIAHRLHSRVVVEVFGKDRPHLTAREVECLRWVALGKDATEIAAILNISPHTTRDYLKSVLKLDCVSSAQAVTKAIRLGLLTLDAPTAALRSAKCSGPILNFESFCQQASNLG